MCKNQICRFDIIETPSETQVNICQIEGTFCAGCDIIIKIQIYMLKSGTPNTIGTSNKVNEVCYMTVSYKKLWKLLIDRDLKKKDLEEMAGVSHYVMNKLTHGDNVTTDVLCKVCKALNCTVDDIMEMIDE